MGNGQSIFYPDNVHRHDRAQQLANDCQLYKNQFETKKADLERELGPYHAKITKVMKAFGCNDLDDLSRLVQSSGTQESINKWNKVKDFYDKTEMVDQVIFGAMGIIAVAGLTVSAVGALAGGIGFFAGIAVTGEILLIFGVLGAILDAILGAVNRSKLRDAINRLFTARLKIKRIVTHLDNLALWMPIIRDIYQTFEDAGYSQEDIIKRLKKKKFDEQVAAGMKDETFNKTGRDLRDMDERRGSWMNEDPDWVSLAAGLQASEPGNARSAGRTFAFNAITLVSQDEAMKNSYQTPESPFEVQLRPKSPGHANELQGVLKISVQSVVSENSAIVVINNAATLEERGHGLKAFSAPTEMNWIISFVDNMSTENFLNVWPTADTKLEVRISSEAGGGYLRADGSLTPEQAPETIFIATYANLARPI